MPRRAASTWFMGKTLSARQCTAGRISSPFGEPETDGREIGLIIDLKALPKEVQTLEEHGTALFCAPHPQS